MSTSRTHAYGNSVRPWITVMKTANENRSSTAVLADDADLQMALGVGVYFIEVETGYTVATAAMDFKHQFNFTGTFTELVTRNQQPAGTAGGTDNETTVTSAYMNTSLSVLAVTPGPAKTRTGIWLTVTGAGTFSYQWAQATSDASNLTLHGGSYIRYRSAA